MILTDFFEPDPKIIQHWLSVAERAPKRRMSAHGPAWHSASQHQLFPEISGGVVEKAMAMVDDHYGKHIDALSFEWWANVLHTAAQYRLHRHAGTCAFVHHLTDGADLHFPDLKRSFPARAGQFIVFESTYLHCTDPVTAPHRVSIAGNLWY